MTTRKLIILASGSGSNAENIVKYFQGNSAIEISLIATNNKSAYVLDRARRLGIPSHVFTRSELNSHLGTHPEVKRADLIILAGFMMLIPSNLIRQFPNRILNIHPALLPNFGGKGMYGDHVHRAVLNQKVTESGITIHLVNEQYDEGEILFQAKCEVLPEDTPQSLAQRIHALEYQHYPKVIDEYLRKISSQ